MGKAKDRITPKKAKAKTAASKPSTDKIDVPKVEFNPQIIVDTEAFAAALRETTAGLRGVLQEMVKTQGKITASMEEQRKLLNAIREQKPPQVNVPVQSRPDDFSVEFNDENGDLTTMRIHANASH